MKKLAEKSPDSLVFLLHPLKRLGIGRRVFAGCYHRPDHGDEKDDGSGIEGIVNGWRDLPLRCCPGNAELFGEDERHRGCEHGSESNEEALQREPLLALIFRQHIGDKGPEWFHADIHRSVEHP